jgi:hypothetical protein
MRTISVYRASKGRSDIIFPPIPSLVDMRDVTPVISVRGIM